MKLSNIKKIRGQGMSEYLIIVALIAVAAIAVTGLFGNAARNQVAAMANEVGGGAKTVSDAANDRALGQGITADNDAQRITTLNNFGSNTDTIKAGATATTSGAASTRTIAR